MLQVNIAGFFFLARRLFDGSQYMWSSSRDLLDFTLLGGTHTTIPVWIITSFQLWSLLQPRSLLIQLINR